ncbi:MAG: hypothetical protein H6825_12910 [Planctomycetes bacterium]|nr:hypothetical protein [Planctomycetota bacterium]
MKEVDRPGFVGRAAILCWGLACIGLSTGCQLDGDAQFFRADEQGYLRPPWSTDWTDSSDVVRRSPNGETNAAHDDTFAIVFDDGYFKYLPDWLGVNEVVVLFEFVEEGSAEEDEGITKVLGPFRRKADGTHSSSIGRYVYGPKVMQGDALRMLIRVIEIDADETANTTALLDFVGGAAESLADPVTKAEITLAKEVGKTLVALNQNDIVLETEITFVPYDEQVWNRFKNTAGEGNGTVIPLRSGSWGVINLESDHWSRSFFTRTTGVEWAGGFWSKVGATLTTVGTLVADIIALPVALFSRSFLDVPDRASLRPLSVVNERVADEGPRFVHIRDDGHVLKLAYEDKRVHVESDGGELGSYTSKSWLTFSIVRGGDPTTWQFRRALAPLEQEVQDLLKQSTVADVLAERKQAVIDAAATFRSRVDTIEANKSGEVKLVDPAQPWGFSSVLVSGIEIEHPVGRTYSASIVSVSDPSRLAQGLTSTRQRPGRSLLTGPAVPAGAYRLVFVSGGAGSAQPPTLSLSVVADWDPTRVTLAPDLSTSAWPAAATLTATFDSTLATLLAQVESVEYLDAAGRSVVVDASAGLVIDETARTVTLTNTTGAAISAGASVTFNFAHGLDSKTK